MRICSYAMLVALMAITSFLSVPGAAHAWAGLRSEVPGIEQGESVALEWSAGDVANPRIIPEIGVVDTDGSVTVKPDKTTTYVLTADTYMFGQPVPVSYEVTVIVIPKS